MKFSTRADMEAPVGRTFDTLSDFGAFERFARRRGVEVTRSAQAGEAQGWHLRFSLRGRKREMSVRLADFERPERMTFAAESKSFDLEFALTLIALSKSRTRLGVELDVRPRSLSGRLLLQSMRLAKSSYSRRFETAIRSFAEKLERNQSGGPAT
jgi:hypothetical protein